MQVQAPKRRPRVDSSTVSGAGGAAPTGQSSDPRQDVIDECTKQAQTQWKSFVDNTREMIDAETGDQVALDADLRQTAGQLEAAITKGESLLE